MRYVIIGNCIAAVGTIEGIRKYDQDGNITVISKENYLAYARPVISEWLSDHQPESKMPYRDEEFYKSHNVEVKLGVSATKIDTGINVVSASDGSEIKYDKLLISTGGKPFVPPMGGRDLEGVFTFMTWDDAKALKKAAKNAKKVVVIGGGLIGTKSAEALFEMGKEVTIVELAPQILGRILDVDGAKIFRNHLEGKGIKVISGNTVEEIVGADGKVRDVILRTGEVMETDLVVIAIGVVPATDIIEGTDIESNRGIIVDERMMTNVENIYAAGDVAEAYDIVAGEKRVIAVLPLAHRQGFVAGANMAGADDVKYTGGFPLNSLQLIGLPLISMGIVEPPEADDYEIITRTREGETNFYKKVVLKNNRVVGIVFVDGIDRAGIFSGLIRSKMDVSDFKDKLLDDNFGLIALGRPWRDANLLSIPSTPLA